MIEPSMLPMIDDHLTRMFELLGGKCVMAILNDVKLVEDAAGPRCEATPLGQGCLPRDLVLGLMEKHLPPELPIVISPGSLERQFAWLGGESRDLSERGQSD